MPLWDNFADQISRLDTVGTPDLAADHLLFLAGDKTSAERSLLSNVPFMLDFMFNISGANTTPVQSTTSKDTFQTFAGIRSIEVYVQQQTSKASGTAPTFDLMNESDNVSILDGTTTASSVLTIANNTTGTTDSAPDTLTVSSPKQIGAFCVVSPAGSTNSTWLHFLFCIS